MLNFQLSQAIEMLSQTPETVKSLLGNLSNEFINATIDANGWSPFDVVGHLIHAEETDWIPRAEVILRQGENKNFPPFDRFGHFEIVKGKTLSELLDEFVEIRKRNLEILKSWNLNEEKLDLKGVHPEFGEVTLQQLLSTWAVHDLTHIRQIVTVLAKQYTANVGEWKHYLSILQ